MKKFGIFPGLVAAFVLFAALTAQAAPKVVEKGIRSIVVEGNERIETSSIVTYTDLRKDDPFEQQLLDRALKNLYATGLFADVSLYQRGSDLVVKVKENPVINEIRFEGNKKLKSEDLKNELQLKPRQVITRTKVQTDVDRLQEMYRLSGRFSAQIVPKTIALDQNRVNLVFEIAEGQETLISRISFIGNKRFSDSALQEVVRSREDRWYRFWTSDDKYDPDRLAYDRELLRKFYLEHGYADFRVENASAELSPDRKDFIVTFSLDEGERYRIGKVDVVSNIHDVDVASLKKVVELKTGEWYKVSDIDKAVTKMTNDLGNKQFAFIDIQTDADRKKDARTVDLKFTVNEGQKTFVDRIDISGNSRTLDEVIRREMRLVESDPFNRDKLKKSEQAIKDLNFFEKVTVTPQPGATPDKTTIQVKVDEKSTGSLSLGAGYSTTDGALADVSVQEKNFLGKGQEVSLSTTMAQKRTQYQFSFTEPYFMKRDLSAGVDLTHVTQDLQTQSSYDSKRDGAGLRLGYPLSENWRQSLNYQYQSTNISNVKASASTFIQQQAGKRTTSLISQGVVYDVRDSKVDPTEGMAFRISTDVTGLGGQSQYYALKAGANYYYPFVDNKVIGSLLGEVGYAHGWGGETVHINERFYLGGDNLRGFEDAGVGPRDTATRDSLGGNRFWRGSAELTMPTGLAEDLGFRAHVFSDAGSLWSVDDSGATVADESSIRMSAGVGISWKSPMGPIRVNLAKPIVKEDYDKVQQFRLSFGTRF